MLQSTLLTRNIQYAIIPVEGEIQLEIKLTFPQAQWLRESTSKRRKQMDNMERRKRLARRYFLWRTFVVVGIVLLVIGKPLSWPAPIVLPVAFVAAGMGLIGMFFCWQAMPPDEKITENNSSAPPNST